MIKISNSSGLSFEFLENGAVKSISADPVRISLKASSPFSAPLANLYLRKRSGAVSYTPLTGPESGGRFLVLNNRYFSRGSWAGIEYACELRLPAQGLGWQWQVMARNTTGDSVDLDLVYAQDVGLKQLSPGLVNEYYVGQYVERRILEDERYGAVVCCRQNLREVTGHPWLVVASKKGAVSGSTDGMQLFGRSFRETGVAEGLLADRLDGEYAGESPVVALQERPFRLLPGETHTSTFVASYLPDHPGATSPEDLKLLRDLMPESEEEMLLPVPDEMISPARNLFDSSPLLPVEDLDEAELVHFFGSGWRYVEKEGGSLLSFFSSTGNHIVLRAKEALADRPHGHIMQAGYGFSPDERIVSVTSFAFGAFSSHLTQGNTNFNTLLSVSASQFNNSREAGQRIFVKVDGRYYLLGVPSAFEMGLNHCRWIYKHGHNLFQVRTWTSRAKPQVNTDFGVISGGPVDLMISHDFDATNGWTVSPGGDRTEYLAKPDPGSLVAGKFSRPQFRVVIQGGAPVFRTGGDEMLFLDGKSHGNPLFTVAFDEATAACISFAGEVVSPVQATRFENPDDQWLKDCDDGRLAWKDLSRGLSIESNQEDIMAIREILPWYGVNALTHFLTPYGLEQFSGAAWGTRDVSQGPIDLLLTMEKYEEARRVLLTIFSNQNPDGGWPQWWMFDSYHSIRAHDSHGDVFYWCIIALANYITTTGDLGILDETVPYYQENGPAQAEKTPLSEHIDRLVRMITGSFIPGTALVPFGGGDWNDSLQPASRELASRMISSWTVEMNYQALKEYKKVLELSGNEAKAGELEDICERIRSDFNRHLVKDGVVAGYGLVEKDRSISLLLHPGDTLTGIRYSILPMERGILSGIFTREQALHHRELIERHLKGPDGARLMDRPLKYNGGIQTIFQRAETSTFFGREIGLMYVHEHIRYAESLAITGDAEGFVRALRQAIPVGYRDVVPCGDIRQANCYYSSSDVAFRSRYEADERYKDVIKGKFTLRGGWRVYSSGPGIYISLIISRLLGLRVENEYVIIDPVLPFKLDDISASMNFLGYPVSFQYLVKEGNFSPKAITINHKKVFFSQEKNRYRPGGAIIPKKLLMESLNVRKNLIEIKL